MVFPYNVRKPKEFPMTVQTARPADGTIAPRGGDLRTARIAGLLYLGLAITGALGFLLVRPALFEPGDAAGTMANLVEDPALARLGIALEMGVVVTQALVALWFFRLFRSVDAFAAAAIAVFGMVNAVAILVSAAALATAFQVALEPVGDPGAAQLLYLVSDNLWGVAALFFGLWLIPMGWCVLQSGSMPRALGWVLVGGGAGYLLSAFLRYLLPDVGVLTDLVTIPATIGEVWMIGHLLLVGTGRRTPD
jgi:Domain of unknown function (DUF4386)